MSTLIRFHLTDNPEFWKMTVEFRLTARWFVEEFGAILAGSVRPLSPHSSHMVYPESDGRSTLRRGTFRVCYSEGRKMADSAHLVWVIYQHEAHNCLLSNIKPGGRP